MLKQQPQQQQPTLNTKRNLKQKQTMEFQKKIYKQFITKYSNHKDFYNLQISNQIISNETAHIVALFKDYLILDDISEFLQRYYKVAESREKLPKIFDYYESCSVIFPNYVILHEAKYICKNIQRKQRLIDHQQQIEEEEERKKNEVHNVDSSVETVFNTKTFDSLCNITGSNSIILRAMGDQYASRKSKKIDNGNNANLNIIDYSDESKSDESVERVLDRIQQCEIDSQRRREDLLGRKGKKGTYNTISIDTEASPIKKSQNYFLNNFLTSNINSSIDKKPQEIKINLKTESNVTSRKYKTKINIIGLTQGKSNQKKDFFHKNTLSMPKLSSKIFHVVNKRIYSINNTDVNQGNSLSKPKYSLISSTNTNTNTNNTSHFVPLTSRDSNFKPKLNIKTDIYDIIGSKYPKKPTLTLPMKTSGNNTSTANNWVVKTQNKTISSNNNNNTSKQQAIPNRNYYSTNDTQSHFRKTQSKGRKVLSSTTVQNKKKGYDNLYDKYQKKSNPISHRNNRNQMANKANYGLFSYDFLTTPLVDIVKTTRQATLSNELGKRREKIVKNFCIKGFEEMIKKKENGMGVSNSEREKERDSKPNGMITSVKSKRIKEISNIK